MEVLVVFIMLEELEELEVEELEELEEEGSRRLAVLDMRSICLAC